MLEWLKRGGQPDDNDPDRRRPRRRRRSTGQFNFTDRTRKVFALARQEAIELGHEYVGTEHLLLALIREGEGVSAEVLRRSDIEFDALIERVNDSVRKGRGAPLSGELPYTSRAKRSIDFAMAAAADLNHSYVGTEHLLIGLLREEKGVAAQVLNSLGLTLQDAARITRELLGAVANAPTDSGFRFRVDDSSDRSIYEQIIQQVEQGIVAGALKPGDPLPEVGEVADELAIAPTTVARAYTELESRGVVVIEGARGIRIGSRRKRPAEDGSHADTLTGLLRPGVMAAFHLGATAAEVREALERAVKEVFEASDPEAQ
ncbi:MAG: Clp protease N-terminal domain-containing protein [Gemmatimonadota bacterium]